MSGQRDCKATARPAAEVSADPRNSLDENQTHRLVIGQGKDVGEGLRGGSIALRLLHVQDGHSGQPLDSIVHTHTQHIVSGLDGDY